MSNKTMVIVGVIIAIALAGYYAYEQKLKPSVEATTQQQQSQPAAAPADPYSNYNAPSK